VNSLDDLGVSEGNVVGVISLVNPVQDRDKWGGGGGWGTGWY
jgi:hypothetical protein